MITMLLEVTCVFLISGVISIEDYDDLVADVENTLDECFTILGDVGSYIDEVYSLQEARRRAADEDDNHATVVKLGACVSMLEAVDTYRNKHNRLVLYQDILRLRMDERAYLRTLLEPLSKKIGDVVYAASLDGDDISDFLRECDNQGPTLVIVETTNGTVFGGYGEWSTSVTWTNFPTAFLFRLRPSFQQWVVQYPNTATHCNNNVVRFGSQLYIMDNALSNRDSIAQGGATYDVDGYELNELNDGTRNFQAKEWFAVKVIDI